MAITIGGLSSSIRCSGTIDKSVLLVNLDRLDKTETEPILRAQADKCIGRWGIPEVCEKIHNSSSCIIPRDIEVLENGRGALTGDAADDMIPL